MANTKPSPDQTVAVRKVREAVMVANQSIACELPWMAAWEPAFPQVVRRTSVT